MFANRIPVPGNDGMTLDSLQQIAKSFLIKD
jgi:hypothetical protein